MRLCVHVQFVKLSVSSVAGQTGGRAKRFLFHVGTSPMYNFLSAASSVANFLCCNKSKFCVAVFLCISFPSESQRHFQWEIPAVCRNIHWQELSRLHFDFQVNCESHCERPSYCWHFTLLLGNWLSNAYVNIWGTIKRSISSSLAYSSELCCRSAPLTRRHLSVYRFAPSSVFHL